MREGPRVQPRSRSLRRDELATMLNAPGYQTLLKPRSAGSTGIMSTRTSSTVQRQIGAPSSFASLKPASRSSSPRVASATLDGTSTMTSTSRRSYSRDGRIRHEEAPHHSTDEHDAFTHGPEPPRDDEELACDAHVPSLRVSSSTASFRSRPRPALTASKRASHSWSFGSRNAAPGTDR